MDAETAERFAVRVSSLSNKQLVDIYGSANPAGHAPRRTAPRPRLTWRPSSAKDAQKGGAKMASQESAPSPHSARYYNSGPGPTAEELLAVRWVAVDRHHLVEGRTPEGESISTEDGWEVVGCSEWMRVEPGVFEHIVALHNRSLEGGSPAPQGSRSIT